MELTKYNSKKLTIISSHDLYAFCLTYGCLEQREDFLIIEKALNINLRLYKGIYE